MPGVTSCSGQRGTLAESRFLWPYFELKAKYYLQLEQLKRRVDERQTKLAAAKAQYRTALNNLETISEEIHAHRRSITTATREQGVGSEGDGDGNEDIANFKMESDGLSMLSVSMDGEGGHSASSEEETDISPTSSSSASPLDTPSATSSSSSTSSLPSSASSPPSSHPHPSSSSLFGPGSFLSTPASSLPCSGPSLLELPCATEPHGPDLMCDSGHVSPVLGPRSQCSGASSPDCDCDQEREEEAVRICCPK
ncbi:hypothetical protein CRUP_007760 [Coryphaenoides rupestris]|nr:hypothetical protein CRUP_007760 [Coryphaenoides rupestris]